MPCTIIVLWSFPGPSSFDEDQSRKPGNGCFDKFCIVMSRNIWLNGPRWVLAFIGLLAPGQQRDWVRHRGGVAQREGYFDRLDRAKWREHLSAGAALLALEHDVSSLVGCSCAIGLACCISSLKTGISGPTVSIWRGPRGRRAMM